jgi:hypothetical protein
LNSLNTVQVLRFNSCGLEKGRRWQRYCGTGRGTAPQQHACIAGPLRQWPGRGRRSGAGGGDTAPPHHACVARPWQESPERGWRAGAGRGVCVPAMQRHNNISRKKQAMAKRTIVLSGAALVICRRQLT